MKLFELTAGESLLRQVSLFLSDVAPAKFVRVGNGLVSKHAGDEMALAVVPRTDPNSLILCTITGSQSFVQRALTKALDWGCERHVSGPHKDGKAYIATIDLCRKDQG